MINNPSKLLSQFNNIVLAYSTKVDGGIRENGKIKSSNIMKFAKKINADIESIVFMDQVHGNNIKKISNAKTKLIKITDGMITNKKNIFLGTTTADCLPVVLYDPKKEIIGALHLGYKGFMVDAINMMIKKLVQLGSELKNVHVFIGPSIGVCCYKVNQERIEKFKKLILVPFEIRAKKYFLDLKTTAVNEFLKNGLLKENIELSSICTKCNSKDFYSYRKNKTSARFLTLIGMK